MERVLIHIQLPKSEKIRLRRLAGSLDMTMTDRIRLALENDLSRQEAEEREESHA